MKSNAEYNNRYTTVFYEGRNLRLYNELEVSALECFYSEIQIKLIELIQKYNFKIFYFKTSPKTKYKIILNESKQLDLNSIDVLNIKNNQREDLLFLYNNYIFEVLFTIPMLNKDNNYYFDFILVVNDKFDINVVYKHSFSLINIESSFQIFENSISYNLIQTIFNQRILLQNCIISRKEDEYDFSSLLLKEEDYFNNYKNGVKTIDFEEYSNIESQIFYPAFDQNKYVNNYFKLLCTHIWSFDQVFYKEVNKSGFCYSYNCIYELNSLYLTNYYSLMGVAQIDLNDKNQGIKHLEYTYSTLSDNLPDLDIVDGSLSVEFLKNGFINFDNLKITNKKY